MTHLQPTMRADESILHAPKCAGMHVVNSVISATACAGQADASGTRRLVGVDGGSELSASKYKIQGISRVKQRHPYVMTAYIGDGMSDLDAGQVGLMCRVCVYVCCVCVASVSHLHASHTEESAARDDSQP